MPITILTDGGQGAHGAVAKATGWEAPAQGSNPGFGTLNFRGLPWGISFKKKSLTDGELSLTMQNLVLSACRYMFVMNVH